MSRNRPSWHRERRFGSPLGAPRPPFGSFPGKGKSAGDAKRR